jgi:hypothetical protein
MEKMTFRQKIENFWYHYKFTAIVVAVFAVFIGVSLGQMFSKKSPDANFLYMGTASISFTSQGLLQESAAVFMKEDYNGDGKKNIDYIELTVLDPAKAQDFDKTTYTSREIDKVAGERFVAELVAGDSMIYLADEKYYEMALEQNVLMPLDEILSDVPENSRDKYSVYLRDLDIFYLPGFNKLPAETVVFVRYPVSLADSKKELENREQNNLSVFRDMFEYTHPDKPEDKVKAAVRVGSEEFLTLYNEWCNNNSLVPSDSPLFTELTDDNSFEKTGATVYKCDGKTFIIFDGQLYSVGRSTDGDGVCDIDICDFDNNGIFDFIFTYTYRDSEWKGEVSVFNLSTFREIFLRVRGDIEDGALYVLERVSDSEFEVWETAVSDEDLTASLTGLEKVRLACSVTSNEGNIVTRAYK